MGYLNVNGRKRFFTRVTKIEKLDRGLYRVTCAHGVYRVEGGTAAGGGRREWFLDGGNENAAHVIRCTSLADALRVLESF